MVIIDAYPFSTRLMLSATGVASKLYKYQIKVDGNVLADLFIFCRTLYLHFTVRVRAADAKLGLSLTLSYPFIKLWCLTSFDTVVLLPILRTCII